MVRTLNYNVKFHDLFVIVDIKQHHQSLWRLSAINYYSVFLNNISHKVSYKINTKALKLIKLFLYLT